VCCYARQTVSDTTSIWKFVILRKVALNATLRLIPVPPNVIGKVLFEECGFIPVELLTNEW
jgi:hypothetical protein